MGIFEEGGDEEGEKEGGEIEGRWVQRTCRCWRRVEERRAKSGAEGLDSSSISCSRSLMYKSTTSTCDFPRNNDVLIKSTRTWYQKKKKK